MTDVNKEIIEKTIQKIQFFQTVQVWPVNDTLNYKGWLNNFKNANDKKIASLILDFFSYFPTRIVNKMLVTAMENAGYQLNKIFPNWKHSDYIEKCYFSFIPGENANPTDSGHIFTRKLRDELEIPEDRIIDFNLIPSKLSFERNKTPIILVDDFVGSGSQCIKAWNENRNLFDERTLKEICEQDSHIFIYAPLIVNQIGYQLIRSHCSSLIITPTHILGPEYNLFNSSCFCWKGNAKLFEEGIELIIRKSTELGIPSTKGYHPQDIKGFGEQGLALSFEHGAPDATLPFFYWCHDDWTPLFNKTYVR